MDRDLETSSPEGGETPESRGRGRPTFKEVFAEKSAERQKARENAREEIRKAGRPTALTPELITKARKWLASGNTRRATAYICGIMETTFSRWMARGQKAAEAADSAEARGIPHVIPESDWIYIEFFMMVEQAEAEAEQEMVSIVRDSAELDPKQAQWWLSRKRPADWGRRDNIQITGAGGGPVELSTARDALAKALDRLGVPAAPPPPVQAPPETPAEDSVAGEGSAYGD